MSTPVYGTVLSRHDRLQCSLILDVSCKSWDLREDDNDLHYGVGIPELANGWSPGWTLTLNFFPAPAASRMRSTKAFAIWFFTGPSFRVLDILNTACQLSNPDTL